MSEVISKELLTYVLNRHVVSVSENIKIREYGPCISYQGRRFSYDINIHELAHKCKEWAWENGYELVESLEEAYLIDMRNSNVASSVLNQNDLTSPERVFKLCQWILENK